MSWWWWVPGLYLVGAVFSGGVLWERERLLNGPREGFVVWLRWWGAYLIAVLFWPIVAVFWWGSRPVPAWQPGPVRVVSSPFDLGVGAVQREQRDGLLYVFDGARWVGQQEVMDMSEERLRLFVARIVGWSPGKQVQDEPPF